VSNAAVSPIAAPITQTPPDVIDKILDINVKAAVMLVQVYYTHASVDLGAHV
jgi:dehydrogenase/reductase SDR family protein 4